MTPVDRPDPTRRVHEDDTGPQPAERELPLLESDIKHGFETELEWAPDANLLIFFAVVIIFVVGFALIWHGVDVRAKVDIERAKVKQQQTVIELPQNDAGGGQDHQ